ncbi:MAG: hypothetical protein NTX50_30935, partial [Candidatus Sumerlaeota bacterium]|nr:hypothetical protein [Candidatus Sumerlaeota bacterium]
MFLRQKMNLKDGEKVYFNLKNWAVRKRCILSVLLLAVAAISLPLSVGVMAKSVKINEKARASNHEGAASTLSVKNVRQSDVPPETPPQQDGEITATDDQYMVRVGVIVESYLVVDFPAVPTGLKEGEAVSSHSVNWGIKDCGGAIAGITTTPVETEAILTATCTIPKICLIIPRCDVFWYGDMGSVVQGHYETTVTLISMIVDLAAANSTEETEEEPGTPIALNDDWDNGTTYTQTSEDDLHRECEPVWDNDFLGKCDHEDDLMRVTISVLPKDVPGTITLTLVSENSSIRLWTSPTKDLIINVPLAGITFSSSQLPMDVFIEGNKLGRSNLCLRHEPSGIQDKINVDVMKLDITQPSERYVIYEYNKEINFNVNSMDASSNYKYFWNLDGDDAAGSGPWESAQDMLVSVIYGPDPSGPGKIQLIGCEENRKKEYDISVSITGGLSLSQRIRVAVDKHYGPPLAYEGTASDRQAEIQAYGPPPGSFDDTPAEGDYSQQWLEGRCGLLASPPATSINNGNRLQYCSDIDAMFGVTYTMRYSPVSREKNGFFKVALMPLLVGQDAGQFVAWGYPRPRTDQVVRMG